MFKGFNVYKKKNSQNDNLQKWKEDFRLRWLGVDKIPPTFVILGDQTLQNFWNWNFLGKVPENLDKRRISEERTIETKFWKISGGR